MVESGIIFRPSQTNTFCLCAFNISLLQVLFYIPRDEAWQRGSLCLERVFPSPHPSRCGSWSFSDTIRGVSASSFNSISSYIALTLSHFDSQEPPCSEHPSSWSLCLQEQSQVLSEVFNLCTELPLAGLGVGEESPKSCSCLSEACRDFAHHGAWPFLKPQFSSNLGHLRKDVWVNMNPQLCLTS